MLLGWAALHQDEPMENWALAERKQELFEIAPLQEGRDRHDARRRFLHIQGL